ncbi:MAG: hypothetical protein GY811_07910, partial [Myxococcales bacterium]|nr:hypothetical protein [Myxococcales bacterium]
MDFARLDGVTRRASPSARERGREGVVAERAAFLDRQPSLDVRRLVFLDESGVRRGSSPRYGWAPLGQVAPGPVVGGHWQTISMIGAIAIDGIRNLITINS